MDRDAPDILPDNPAFFKIRYPAGYRILQFAGYPANLLTVRYQYHNNLLDFHWNIAIRTLFLATKIVSLPDIRYPAFRLAVYPAKPVSGASLLMEVSVPVLFLK
jgi:hypothetical protein